MTRTCQACGCLEDYHARGYCLKHYQALWRKEAKLDKGERERKKYVRQDADKNAEDFWQFVKQELGIG